MPSKNGLQKGLLPPLMLIIIACCSAADNAGGLRAQGEHGNDVVGDVQGRQQGRLAGPVGSLREAPWPAGRASRWPARPARPALPGRRAGTRSPEALRPRRGSRRPRAGGRAGHGARVDETEVVDAVRVAEGHVVVVHAGGLAGHLDDNTLPASSATPRHGRVRSG